MHWVRCGTGLFLVLIFAFLFTLEGAELSKTNTLEVVKRMSIIGLKRGLSLIDIGVIWLLCLKLCLLMRNMTS